MLSPKSTVKQIQIMFSDFLKTSLCDDYRFPSISDKTKIFVIGIKSDLSKSLKNVSYKTIYNELLKQESFHIKMLDGALIQFLYIFKDNIIVKHRLAFFPSPNLEDYQNSPEIYENNEVYGDVLNKSLVPFPIRFDYDPSNALNKIHPSSHLTLGQYKNCRIPVSSPLTPYNFSHFIVNNFYNTSLNNYSENLTRFDASFYETITSNEKKRTFLQVPN